jgi:hypothetical protein
MDNPTSLPRIKIAKGKGNISFIVNVTTIVVIKNLSAAGSRILPNTVPM